MLLYQVKYYIPSVKHALWLKLMSNSELVLLAEMRVYHSARERSGMLLPIVWIMVCKIE